LFRLALAPLLFDYNRRMSISFDRLVRSRRKTVAIILERDGRLTVRAPLRMPESSIRAFIDSHTDWIIKSRTRLSLLAPIPPRRYMEGEKFLFLGKAYPLAIVPRQRSALTFDGTAFRLAKSAVPKAENAFVRWYKEQAACQISEHLLTLAKRYGFQYQKLRISSARTRWGSCSSLGTLSFTYRLIMAPPQVLDYVILHELVHTRVRNHSRTFWNTLGKLMPDYENHVSWLKKNGRKLI
jgi:predicted metal-dependent hydrolase